MATLLGGERYIEEDIYEEARLNHFSEFYDDYDEIKSNHFREFDMDYDD